MRAIVSDFCYRLRAPSSVSMILMGIVHTLGVALCFQGSAAFGQTDSFAHDLQTKLDRYYDAKTPLVLDMQFNQPAYVPGDTAWFSMWLTTEREGFPVAGRQIIQVNLNKRTGDVVLRQRVLMNNGIAHGQIVVPASLEPGIYTIVSWTNWMANDSPDMYCYREFVVVGERAITRGPMTFSVHAEGGALVDGVPNLITIAGRPGVTASVFANQQLMHKVTLDNLGYGQLSFTPRPGDIIIASHGSDRLELPHGNERVALNVLSHDTLSTVTLNVRSPVARNGSHVAIVSRGRLLYTAMISFVEGQATVTVPRRILGEDLVVATIFSDRNEVLAERLFLANPPSNPIQLKSRYTTAHPRDSISVEIEALGLGSLPLMVSVYPEDLFPDEVALPNALLPMTRLPLAALAFRTDPKWTLRQWNSFLVTQHWKRFQWSDVFTGIHDRLQPSAKYLNFKGNVILPSGTGMFDSVRITFFLRHEARVYEQYVDQTGAFDVDLFFDFDNEEEVIYTIDRKGTIWPDATVLLTADETPSPVLPSAINTSLIHPYAAFSSLRQSVTAAHQNYERIASADEIADPNASVEDELFEADVVVKLDDYLLFPSMEETLREIVPKLQHRWKGKQHTVRVALSEPDMLALDEPIYFIDGVLTDDTNYFMSLNPKDLLSIKIVSVQQKLRAMGILGRNGVVLVTTKGRNLNVPRTRKSFMATGITRPIRFNNTRPKSRRIPMLRSAAYVNPQLTLDPRGNGKIVFFLPDNTGSFVVEVTGLSQTGASYKAATRVRSLPPTSTP